MEARKSRGPLLDHLDEIEARCLEGDPTLKEIFNVFGPEGHYVLLLFLIIPFLQPVPLLGLSTPFGILIAVVAVYAYLRRPPWLPERWADRKVSAKTVSRIAEGSERVFEKLAFVLHPRGAAFFVGPFRTLNAVVIVVHAILLALPLPIPFSNAIPAWVIAFQTLAHLERDGMFVALSYVQAALCIVYFFLLAKGVGIGIEMFWS